MKKVSDILSHNPKYKQYQKPLRAARVCDAARTLGKGRFEVVSFALGVLCLGVVSPAESMQLQSESSKIISQINQKLGKESVKRIRFKIT